MPGSWLAASTAHDRAAALGSAELVRLRASGHERHVARGVLVARAGSPAVEVLVVSEGELGLFVRDSPRRRALIVLRPGDVFADVPLLLGSPVPYDAVALRDSRVVALTTQTWRQALAGSADLALWWLTSIARRLDAERRRLMVITGQPLPVQVAYLLRELAEPDGDELVVRVSQELIAQLLGARRQSVARVLARLRAQGVVETRYAVVVLRNPAALAAMLPGA